MGEMRGGKGSRDPCPSFLPPHPHHQPTSFPFHSLFPRLHGCLLPAIYCASPSFLPCCFFLLSYTTFFLSGTAEAAPL